MTPTTTHLIRVDRLAFWSRRPGQWQARCGTCAWDGRYDDRDAAVRAGERHRDIVGQQTARVEDDGTEVFGPAADHKAGEGAS